MVTDQTINYKQLSSLQEQEARWMRNWPKNTSHTLSWNVHLVFFVNMQSFEMVYLLSCTLSKLIFSYHLKGYYWQLYSNYLQSKTREQLAISCGTVTTSFVLDSGSVRFSAHEKCCSDATCTPSFDMIACLRIFSISVALRKFNLTNHLLVLTLPLKKSLMEKYCTVVQKKCMSISQNFLSCVGDV